MKRAEFVAAVAQKADVTVKEADATVSAVFDTIQATMADGDDVRIVGFGTFAVAHREATKGRNPSTGQQIDIPARKVARFSPGRSLKEAINGQ